MKNVIMAKSKDAKVAKYKKVTNVLLSQVNYQFVRLSAVIPIRPQMKNAIMEIKQVVLIAKLSKDMSALKMQKRLQNAIRVNDDHNFYC